MVLSDFDSFLKGNEADPRMRAASKRRGIAITSISRPIQPSDFVNFDLILAMDKQNRGMREYYGKIFVFVLCFAIPIIPGQLNLC